MDAAVIGCGYLGFELARELVQRGHRVWGIRRQFDDTSAIRSAGIKPLEADVTRPETLKHLPRSVEWVINAVSSMKGDSEVYQQVYLQGTRHLIRHLSPSPTLKRYLHVSSTSVYGQTDGSWITEAAERCPTTATSRVLVETEDELFRAHHDQQFPASVVRASGIYGPGRGYLFQQYLKNQARLIGDGSRLINMIHVTDLVGAMIALLEHGQSGMAYNVTDSEPVTQLEFFTFLSQQLDKPLPPAASAGELKQRKRALTNKRVSNRRLIEEIGYQFNYPSFRQGYAAEIEALPSPL